MVIKVRTAYFPDPWLYRYLYLDCETDYFLLLCRLPVVAEARGRCQLAICARLPPGHGLKWLPALPTDP